MKLDLQGPALVFGHEVNTDELHPSSFFSLDDRRVRDGFLRHVPGMSEVGQERAPGRIVLAGRTFGIGSSRETGARVFKLAGIQAVVAVSFARIFARNLLNLGVPALSCPALELHLPLEQGIPVQLEFSPEGGVLRLGALEPPGSKVELELEALDPYWQQVLAAGGLVGMLGGGEV